jgi:hypothetical protein
LVAGWMPCLRNHGARLAATRCTTFEVSLSPGETWARPAGGANPVARFEVRRNAALARTTGSRAAAVGAKVAAALATASMNFPRSFSPSSASLTCSRARRARPAAAADAIAKTDDQPLQGVEAVEELPTSTAAAAAIAAPRHGGAASRATPLCGVMALEKASGRTEPQGDSCRGPLPTEAPMASGLTRTLRRRAGAAGRAGGSPAVRGRGAAS